jgi:hypothetical protein
VNGKADLLNYYNQFVGTPDYVRQDAARYDAVTAADVQRVARRYLTGHKVVLTVVPQEGASWRSSPPRPRPGPPRRRGPADAPRLAPERAAAGGAGLRRRRAAPVRRAPLARSRPPRSARPSAPPLPAAAHAAPGQRAALIVVEQHELPIADSRSSLVGGRGRTRPGPRGARHR